VRGKLIAFEGLDASGKSTQIRLLLKALAERKIKHERISFPRTREPGYGEAIAMFLRGELGSVAEVNPYLIAGLYAGDRATARPHLEERLKAGTLVIADRYTYSNLAFQAAKIADPAAKREFLAWLRRLEFESIGLPVPELAIFFDAPLEFVRAKLSARQVKERRGYLKGKADIHESALDLQERVAVEYRALVAEDPNFIAISLAAGRSIAEIHREVMETLEARGIL
jgi:dTMP kinase